MVHVRISSKHYTSVLHLSKIVHPPKPAIPSISVQMTVAIAHSLKWKCTSNRSLFEALLLNISPRAGRISINRPPFKTSTSALLNGVIRCRVRYVFLCTLNVTTRSMLRRKPSSPTISDLSLARRQTVRSSGETVDCVLPCFLVVADIY
eukprot:scaffold1640_cov161-Amphora_coffeaeformis.AAC.37